MCYLQYYDIYIIYIPLLNNKHGCSKGRNPCEVARVPELFQNAAPIGFYLQKSSPFQEVFRSDRYILNLIKVRKSNNLC